MPKKKIERYEELIKLGQLVSCALDTKTLVKRSTAILRHLVNCEQVILLRYDQKSQELFYLSHQESKSGKQLCTEIRLSVDEKTFAGECAHYMAIRHIKDIKSDIRYARLPDSMREMELTSIVSAPLVSKGELVGVIQAINPLHDEFNEDDIEMMQLASGQLAIVFENLNLLEQLNNRLIQVVQSLADAIGKKDAYTGGHTKRVKHFAEMIAAELDLSGQEMQDLKLAAVLHDIGKIGIDDKILKKSAPLTDEEFEIMKNHPRLGYEILGHIDGLESVIDGMRFHHERPDGKGYPFGLKGDEIPTLAMIISVADTFDAMISTRPYRKGLPPQVAFKEIVNNSGTQFSEKVVEAFVRAFENSAMMRNKVDKNKKAS
ncbi:MAG: HD domain-containing protein [Bdellovibrio sp.]